MKTEMDINGWELVEGREYITLRPRVYLTEQEYSKLKKLKALFKEKVIWRKIIEKGIKGAWGELVGDRYGKERRKSRDN